MAVSYIESWTLLNDDDKYVNLCLATIRNIFTYIKNLKPKITNYTETYRQAKKHELMSPTRFDTIEKQVKTMSHKNLYNSKYNDMMREYNFSLGKKAEPFKDTPLGFNPQEIKQQLMRGNGNIIGSA